MITTKMGATQIRGSLAEVKTDLTIILREFRVALSENYSDETIDKFIDEAVSLAKKNEADLVDEILKKIMEVLR